MSVCGGRCLWGSIDGGDRWCSRWFHAARLNGGRRSRRRGRHLRGASRRRRCPTPGPGPSARRMNGHHRDTGRNAGNWDLEPPARRRCSNHWTSKDDIVRLRVTKRGQQQPDHIATYRVFWEASERYPARVRLGDGDHRNYPELTTARDAPFERASVGPLVTLEDIPTLTSPPSPSKRLFRSVFLI